MSKFNIRPHHGLCIHFFRGKGYSQEFVENMTNVVKKLEENPTIHLVSGADVICGSCPNLSAEHLCSSLDKVANYDEKVLELCGLSGNSSLSWEEFATSVREHILEKGLRTQVCGHCQWTDICQ